jgi:hypothetical protein
VDEPRRGLVRIIERQAIHRGTFGSVKELNAKIRAFIDSGNERCHPFIWTKTADQILAKANRQKDFQLTPLVSSLRALRAHGASARMHRRWLR